jgi:hypothetical protein
MISTGAPRAVRVLHAALVAGLSSVGATFLFLQRGLRIDFGFGAGLGRVFAVMALVVLAVALFFLRSRIPQRRSDQSPDEYWSARESRDAAIILWAIVQGAGLVGWVGYLLTGSVAPGLIAVVSILSLILIRPSRIEGPG